MYYYFIYAYKGDHTLEEFAAYSNQTEINEVFDDLNQQGYDCIVIDELTKDQYEAQHNPYFDKDF